ncbi:MAG: NAD-dependent epimerase/dehydratase family protein [Bacillota bacterium]|nr:NAD-dependent epimerase/dehydratase family protein [Bacillota bacterium]
MKVLVTGGYGFIGSHVVERFYREGHEVYIIDDLSTGNVKNVSCKHKGYKFNVVDKKCDEIFKINKFHIVVHLAAQIDISKSIESPFMDARANILGLVNMLELSVKYKVRKFIFASSAAVYGNNENIPLKEDDECIPVSPYGFSKHIGEQYCNKWMELFHLDTICFRFSNVYGPRQGINGDAGVISTYMNRIMNGQEVNLFGSGEQTRDFVYVDDVAEAIYKASESYAAGVFNVSTSTQSSINEIISILGRLHKIKGIVKKEARNGDIKHSCLDNTKIKKTLDWVPLNNLEEGLKQTYVWFYDNYKSGNSKEEQRQKKKKHYFIKKALPYIENIIFFMIILLLDMFLKKDSAFKTIDLKIIYIIIVGIVYGTGQSIISIILSCTLFTYESMSIGKDFISLLFDTGFLLQLNVYILIGMLVGYVIDKREKDANSSRLTIEAMEEEYSFLQELYNETYEAKVQLQNQIINSEDSFGKIYGVIREIDSLEPECIFESAIDVLEKILKTDEISIYIVDRNEKYLRLTVKSSKDKFLPAKTISSEYFMEAKEQIFHGEIFVNKDMNQGMPMLIAPVVNDSKTIAVIMLHNVEFERLNLYYENLFRVACKLINSAIIRAYLYEKAIDRERYIEGTIFLKKEFFEKMLSIKIKAMVKNKSEFSMLKISNPKENYMELSQNLSELIRETDFTGVGADNDIYIVLSNAADSDSRLVINRLKDKGIEAYKYSGED